MLTSFLKKSTLALGACAALFSSNVEEVNGVKMYPEMNILTYKGKGGKNAGKQMKSDNLKHLFGVLVCSILSSPPVGRYRNGICVV